MLGKPGDEPAYHNEQSAQEDQGHGATHQLNQIHSGKQQALKNSEHCIEKRRHLFFERQATYPLKTCSILQ
jgi:hypothetical protein